MFSLNKETLIKTGKYGLIITFTLLYLLVQLFNPELLPGYDFFWTFISVGAALALYLYNDSIFFFSIVNNIRNSCFRKPQVTWKIYYTFQTNQSDCFKSLSDKMINESRDSSLQIIENDDNLLVYDVEKPDIRRYSLSSLLLDEDTLELTCSYKCTLSYKKSKSELNLSTNFFNSLFMPIGKIDTMDQQNPLITKPSYRLELSFSKFNPVYGLMTKRLSQNKIDNFSLTFQEKSAQITIEKNCMTIICSDLEDLQYVSKNYIALSDVT